MVERADLIRMTTDIVSAYVQNNPVDLADLPNLINQTFGALTDIASDDGRRRPFGLEPPVPIDQSITDDHIICLEDGKPFKSLKRHLRSHYDLSPEEYRAKWGLPSDYPMVAPNYAKARSQLARDMQLGKSREED